MQKSAETLFNRMNREVRYVNFKSSQHIKEGLDGTTDLDILIHQDDYEKMKQILLDLHFLYMASSKEQTYNNVEQWFGMDEVSGKLLQLHLHYALITGKTYVKEYHLKWEGIAFCTSGFFYKNEVNVRTVCPEFEIILLLTRVVCKASLSQKMKYAWNVDKYISADFKREYLFLRKRIKKEEFIKNCKSCYPAVNEEQAKKIYDIIVATEKLNEVYEFFRRQTKAQFKIKLLPELYHGLVSLYFKISRCSRKCLKKPLAFSIVTGKVLPYQGKIISIIGCDGTGKSTISKAVEEWLSWKFEAKRVYFGSGNGYFSIYKSIKRLLLSKTGDNKIRKEKLSKIKRSNFIVRKLEELQYYKISVKNKRLINKIQRYVRKGAIVITDRYPQMQFEGIYDGPKIKNKNSLLGKLEYSNFMEMQAMHPDLLIKLLLTYDEIVQRRPEDNREELKKKIYITENLAFKDAREIVIDASLPLEQELIIIKRYIWEELQLFKEK